MIKADKKLFAAVAAMLMGMAYWGWLHFKNTANAAVAVEKTAVHGGGDTLHFEANAPQLAFLQIKPAEAFPEPLAEPLNARIAYDDNHTARVFSPIAGRVVGLAVEAGKQVKAGDPLLTLDAPDFAQAVADNAKAEADQARKKEDYERARQLLEVQGIARKDVEAAEADWRQAEAEAQRAKARLQNLNGLSPTEQGLYVLRAPIAGTVSERQVNAGSEVRPDATLPLFVISDPKKLWVLVDVPERQFDKIMIGQPVSIEVDAYPGETFKGKVDIVGEALDPVTRRIQVRCEVDNSSRRLKPEMFARVTPVANSDSSMPRVENTALVTEGVHTYLFVEKTPGVLQRRQVKLAMQGSEYSYVQEGLRAGERVVTSGALLLNSELSGND